MYYEQDCQFTSRFPRYSSILPPYIAIPRIYDLLALMFRVAPGLAEYPLAPKSIQLVDFKQQSYQSSRA
jgi:hypothetical protein